MERITEALPGHLPAITRFSRPPLQSLLDGESVNRAPEIPCGFYTRARRPRAFLSSFLDREGMQRHRAPRRSSMATTHPWELDYHFVLDVFVPLVLLVLVAVATRRDAVLRVLGHVRHVRVDAFRVQRRHRPGQRGRLEVGYGRVPRGQVSRPFRLATLRRQLLDGL